MMRICAGRYFLIFGYEKIGRAVIAKAVRGDVQAAAFVAKILGEDILRVADVPEGGINVFVIPKEWTEEQCTKWIPIITQCNKSPWIQILEDEVEDCEREGADALICRPIFVGLPDPSND